MEGSVQVVHEQRLLENVVYKITSVHEQRLLEKAVYKMYTNRDF